MACNCASDELLKEIIGKYGENKNTEGAKNAAFKTKMFLANLYANIMAYLSIPYMLYFIFRENKNNDGKISLSKFFKIGKYAEQKITYQN